MRPQTIGIVGLGIAGSAAACLLARQGHRITVLERAPRVGPVGTGILLQLSGQVVLHRLGLLEQVLAASEPLSGLHAFLPSGRTLIHLRYADTTPEHCGYGVHRGTLFELLHRAAQADGVEIILDREITGYRVVNDGTGQRGSDRVYAFTASGEQHGPFDFLIAADGSRSQLRGQVVVRCRTKEYHYGALWLLGRNTQVHGYLHQIVSGTDRLLGLLPVGGQRCTLFWGIRNSELPALRERGVTAFRDEVLRLSPLAEETLQDIDSFDQVAFTTYRHAVPKQSFNAHVICLGDSAHAMSPHLGQGANLALLDAAHFADAIQSSQSLAEATFRFHRARYRTVRYYARLSRLLTPFFQSDVGLLGWARNIALPLMTSIPPLRREMTRSLAGIKRGFFARNFDHAMLKIVEKTPQIVAAKGENLPGSVDFPIEADI
jgi:2-polyprenyl-6-methoxyphenol hydroxylase-like FAD-dependent oxidoreductase